MTRRRAMPLLREEQRRHMHAALQELTPIDREILMMHYLEELTFPEIAAILDIGEGAAKMRHLRALRRIRALMAGDGGPRRAHERSRRSTVDHDLDGDDAALAERAAELAERLGAATPSILTNSTGKTCAISCPRSR